MAAGGLVAAGGPAGPREKLRGCYANQEEPGNWSKGCRGVSLNFLSRVSQLTSLALRCCGSAC